MNSSRTKPRRLSWRFRSALFLLVGAVLVAPACTYRAGDSDGDIPITAASNDRPPVPPPPGQTCDDGNPCTQDLVDGTACAFPPEQAGRSCDNGNSCDGAETCDGHGLCMPGVPPVVDDGNECTHDHCDPITGMEHVPLTGNACTDACGMAGTCSASGECGQDPLDDQNPCTTDSCDATLGVLHINAPGGTPCDDGNVCNGIAMCDGFGACTAAAAPPEGTSCSDGNLCNGAETCGGGRCNAGPPPAAGTSCEDGNPCTELDACDGFATCIGAQAPAGTACDDGNPCTEDDACDGGTCDGDAASGVPCGDHDACNGVDACVDGECVAGTPPVVDDGDPDTLDTCDPITGEVAHCECPLVDLTVPTTLVDMVECLYSGPSPIQTGLTQTIHPLHAAAVHGRVLGAGGEPLAGVSITLEKRITAAGSTVPQLVTAGYGSTLTRADGAFDLALNGGGALVLEYSRDGYLPAQREVIPQAGRFVTVADVVLKPLDLAVTPIEIGAGAVDMQVARGSVVSDARGTRQTTLFFKPGTTATLNMPNGTTSTLPAGDVHVRATEYTVGPEGPTAMPASLPPSSAYTYAVELSLDEAIDAGASTVSFDPPVIAYLENFVGFPIGENVPAGAYRADAGLWEVQQNGRVVKVTGVTAGVAALDIDNNPGAETDAQLATFGIGLEERQRLAELYAPGQSLWRIPVAHFSPWDWNWGWGPTEGAAAPNVLPVADNPKDDPCTQHGSIIGCETRSLGEPFGVVGTPFTLHYQSDRTPGYKIPIHVPATGDTLPPGTLSVKVEFDVAGQHYAVQKPPLPNTSVDFVWDGKNGFGQPVQGPQTAEVSVGYEFERGYGGSGSFGGGGSCGGCLFNPPSGGGGPGMVSNFFATATKTFKITLWQRHRFPLHHYNAVYLGLGGLTLDVHHVYDPSSAALYLGNGEKRTGDSLVTLSTFAGGGQSQANNIPAKSAQLAAPDRLARGPDGSFYVATSNAVAKIVRIDPNEMVTTVWTSGAGSIVRGLAVGPDGAVYFSDTTHHQVFRMPLGGSPQVVAGTGAAHYYGNDGTPATSAALHSPHGVAVGPDGSVYIADTENHRIMRVDASGKIWRIAGSAFCHTFKTSEECGDGGPATSADMNGPEDLAVGLDGTVYVADTGAHRVRAIGTDGIMRRVAGLAQGLNNQVSSDPLSGVPAKSAKLVYPKGITASSDGSLYISDTNNGVVRRIDPPLVTPYDESSDANGKIYTIAGTGPAGAFSGEGGLATAAALPGPRGVVTSSDGTLYFADISAARIFRVRPAMPGMSLTKTSVVSEGGTEVYVFDETRRHEKTIDSMTGRTLYAFQYDGENLLSKVIDAEGHETNIIRDAQAGTVAIVGPWGHTTSISLGADGYAQAVESPDGEAMSLTYTAPGTGLLAALVDPNGHQTVFTYDENGRLSSDSGPGGSSKGLVTNVDDGVHHSVSVITAQGRTTTYETDLSDPKVAVRKVTTPEGLTSTTERTKLTASAPGAPPAGQTKTTAPDGTTVTLDDGPDPRLGMQAPFAKQIVTKTGGITQTVTRARTATYPAGDITNVSALVDQTNVNSSATWTSAYSKLANGSATWTRTTPLGRQGTVTLDTAGRVVQMTAPGLAPVVVEYLTVGPNKGRVWRVSQTSGADVRQSTLAYDGAGNVTQVTSPLSELTHYLHDINGRITQTTTHDGRVFAFQYDAGGNVTAVLPPGPGGDHHFAYDGRDFVSKYTPADVGPLDEATYYQYSPDGEPSLVTLPDSTTIETVFDSAGRITAVASPDGATTFTYHANNTPSKGKLATVTSPDGVAQAWDPLESTCRHASLSIL